MTEIAFDPAKRTEVLAARGLDLARAGELFACFHLTRADHKHSTDEQQFHSIDVLEPDVVIVTWTPRGDTRRIVTMWKANERERARYYERRNRTD